MKNKYNLKFTVPYVITALGLVAGISAASKANTDREDAPADVAKNITVSADSTMAEPAMPRLNTDSILAAQARPSKVRERGRDVIYICNNGDEITRRKGSRAWRNNNPGNLVYTSFSRDVGAVGECGGYAVFPDEETGMNALRALLRTTKYQRLTIAAAIGKYAPEGPSGVALYIGKLKKLTGLHETVRLSELSDAQLELVANSIREIEGWIPGNESRTNNPAIARANAIAMRDSIARNMNMHTL